MAAFLVDSNILIYMHDPRDKAKQQQAFNIFDYLVERGSAVLSAQSLTEFFNIVRARLPEPISQLDAIAQVERFILRCPVLSVTPLAVLEACRCSNRYSLSIWDSLIWAVARLNGVPGIITEDTHGPGIEGVRYFNPFDPAFDKATLETI